MQSKFSFSNRSDQPVSFGQRLATSDAFKALFREGMSLVEDSANYLDGAGRTDAKRLARSDALAYASESMRLTTRLMQLASWLLLQRAVNEGEMTQTQAATEKHKVRLTRQDTASNAEVFLRLPARLQELAALSLRLQERVMHLDGLLYAKSEPQLPAKPLDVHLTMARLQAAFQPG
jgi:regulator of CtrA degradation